MGITILLQFNFGLTTPPGMLCSLPQDVATNMQNLFAFDSEDAPKRLLFVAVVPFNLHRWRRKLTTSVDVFWTVSTHPNIRTEEQVTVACHVC